MEKTRRDRLIGVVVGAVALVILGTSLPAIITRYVLPVSYFLDVRSVGVRVEDGTLYFQLERWVRYDMAVTVTGTAYERYDGGIPRFTLSDRRIFPQGWLNYEIPMAAVTVKKPGRFEMIVLFEAEVGDGVVRRKTCHVLFEIGDEVSE